MGKSTAAKLLTDLGIAVTDTDAIAREIVQPGQDALHDVVRRFGNEIIGPDGQLRRDELARRVFADVEARRDLESILHPRIRERWLRQIDQWRERGESIGVVVIPVLFETSPSSISTRPSA
jgi:dephospho-CoA kinase